MKAIQRSPMPFFSVAAIPILGVGALLLCLWHPKVLAPTDAGDVSKVFLLTPDPRLDKSLSICLRQQAKEVVRYRHLARPTSLMNAIADYNLVASECAPSVFQTTGLPPSLEL